MQSFDLAAAHIHALAGDPGAVVDLRLIHDSNPAVQAVPLRGVLSDMWQTILTHQATGYGCFITLNEMDGAGRHAVNVRSIRAHVVDLDDPATAPQSYGRAAGAQPAPTFAVMSSPGKAHIYWCVQPYADAARFTVVQRKLVALYHGDPTIIDTPRVLRLAGTLHLKRPDAPVLVTCHALPGYGTRGTLEALETALQGVQTVEGGNGGRHSLGTPELAAPSAQWARSALFQVDPNSLDRGEWITVTSAFKQSIWSHVTPDEALAIYQEWCGQYASNNPDENVKQWNSLRSTEVGWTNLSRRSPNTMAWLTLGDPASRIPPQPQAYYSGDAVPPMPAVDASFGEFLTAPEQMQWFKDCYFIVKFGQILQLGARMMNQNQFTAVKGGKKFIIDNEGKTTDEPWKAALRSTLWQVPKIDHTRFLPHRPTGEIVTDSLGRTGINTYQPSIVPRVQGDATPFLRHLQLLFPNPDDLRIYVEYLAHNIQFPGYKIAWAPVLVSAEGAGKGIIKTVIQHAIGRQRMYSPNAQELINSGSKFNAWMREKLFIIVDEIKVDERRELVEILKPMISDAEIEIQGKGQDQDMEDNYANWQFHSNYKDAIPINKNGRRYAIFYLAAQSNDDLIKLGMDEAYFRQLLAWVEDGGAAIMADWFMRYPIARGSIPHRAPATSSTSEAMEQSRSPLEQVLHDALEQGATGFRGGWVSLVAFKRAAVNAGIQVRNLSTLTRVLEAVGYHRAGRSDRPYFQEDAQQRSTLYALSAQADVQGYGRAQGYE